MRNVFSRALLVTPIAVGALYPGVVWAQDPKLVQTNLVSDIANLAKITDPELVKPLGRFAQPHAPILGFEPGENTATLYDITDETNVTKVNINPPSGFVAIPTTAAPAPQGRPARSTIPTPSVFR